MIITDLDKEKLLTTEEYFKGLESKTRTMIDTFDALPDYLMFNDNATKAVNMIREQHRGMCSVLVAIAARKEQLEKEMMK